MICPSHRTKLDCGTVYQGLASFPGAGIAGCQPCMHVSTNTAKLLIWPSTSLLDYSVSNSLQRRKVGGAVLHGQTTQVLIWMRTLINGFLAFYDPLRGYFQKDRVLLPTVIRDVARAWIIVPSKRSRMPASYRTWQHQNRFHCAARPFTIQIGGLIFKR